MFFVYISDYFSGIIFPQWNSASKFIHILKAFDTHCQITLQRFFMNLQFFRVCNISLSLYLWWPWELQFLKLKIWYIKALSILILIWRQLLGVADFREKTRNSVLLRMEAFNAIYLTLYIFCLILKMLLWDILLSLFYEVPMDSSSYLIQKFHRIIFNSSLWVSF